MSVQSEITRISNGVNDALNAVAERGVAVTESDNVSTLGNLIRSIPSGGEIPALTKAQRDSLVSLAKQYYNQRSGNFVYTGGVNRNHFASSDCFDSSGKIMLNCSTYVQMIWAGISPASFIGKKSSYTGGVSKTFNWGYWFQFPYRKFYHLTAPNGEKGALTMYGYVQPNPNTYEGAYSTTTYYSPNGVASNKYQFPKTYMTASDMARELKFLGCEIPLNEAMPGDIVFLKAARLDDGNSDETENAFYMNINHVAIITDANNLAGNELEFYECSPYYGSYIGRASISMTTIGNSFRAVDIADRIVMVARHPIAFGITSTVPNTITTI
jgi:hypothetical protein